MLLHGTRVRRALTNPQMSLTAILLIFLDLIQGRWRLRPILGLGALRNVPIGYLGVESTLAVRTLFC